MGILIIVAVLIAYPFVDWAIRTDVQRVNRWMEKS